MLVSDQDTQGLRNQYYIKKPITQNSINKNIKNINKILVAITVILFSISLVYRIIQQARIIARNSFYNIQLVDHVKLQQPRQKNPQVLLWKIQKNNQSKENKKIIQQDTACALINAGNIVTIITTNTITNFLSSDSFSLVYVFTDYADRSKIKQLQKFGSFKTTLITVKFDQDFFFMRNITQGCKKVAYLFGNYQIIVSQIQNQIKHLQSDTFYFTSSMMKNDQVINLPNLLTLDLQTINHNLLYSYLYIFDTRYLQIIAPTNLIYYGKYTIEEIILLPTLILYQSAGKMITSTTLMHSFPTSFIQFKQLPIQSPDKQDNSICFISYPSDLQNISAVHAIQHIKTIENLDKQNFNISFILYLPYNFGKNSDIFELAQYLATHSQIYSRVRLRIVADKTYPSYVVYDGVYSYCPSKSLIISARHNVRFYKQMLTIVIQKLSQKYHYYVFDLNSTFKIQPQLSKQYGDNLLENKLLYTQVFKSDLFKMIQFWTLKSAELEFYQTQTPFVRQMMQVNNYSYAHISKVLANVLSRSVSQKQKNQIKYIKSYTPQLPINYNILTPYKQNSLFNVALRRNAPQKISRIIHQIWIGKNENSQLRKALFKSLVKSNPGFKIIEWNSQNLTKQNFPITLHFVQMILQKHKDWRKSLYTMAADLMRYEILVQNGGIYLDYKFQGRKPLDNFLKYQLFFQDFDIDIIRFGSPKAVGNGVIGATKNNYHLKITLHQLFKQNNINFKKVLTQVTGGFLLRKSLTNYQLFTNVILGYHLFIARPYEEKKDFCGGVNRNFGQNYTVFTIDLGEKQKAMKIPFPCDIYPQSYVVLYSPIMGTWLNQKKTKN